MKYKIGQILTSKKDIEVEKALSGEKVIIPEGSKIIIGSDGFAYYIRTGMIQPLAEGDKVEGYDNNGLAEYIYTYLRNHLPLDEMLESYYEDKQSFIEEVECALDEIL